uniref:Phytanoyl-CoA dioxygenase n=2 Tax=Aplanochytrium stocchinoi TaxID=215587 RepID=A0A7S3PRB8_9STRA|mmetsp:Transcript_16118/g.19980  ORF Transcript_16118/g.19980 Transcript_16118/m.19980 type:complete len:310 (-) Transcript_16118:368-1297(-)
MTIFSDSEIESFIRNGFVTLRNAFPRDVAIECREILWSILKHERNIIKEDPETWTEERVGLKNIFRNSDGPPWSKVFTERLLTAIDELLGGRSKWSPEALGCGWWVINFPMKLEPPWGACGNWHVDGSFFKHKVDSKEQGLLPIFLFNDILPESGGTALAVGSHMQVAQLLYENPQGLSVGEITRSILQNQGILDNIFEVTGRGGDVVLTHPFLLHARSKNLGVNGVNSVRFICNPCIALKNKLNVHENSGGDGNTANVEEGSKQEHSPVEKAIIESKSRCLIPLSFGKRKSPQTNLRANSKHRRQRRR